MTANSTRLRAVAKALGLSSLALAAVTFAGCKADEVINANQPSPAAIDADVRGALQIRASGAMALQRALLPGFISNTGILGRESLNYTGTDSFMLGKRTSTVAQPSFLNSAIAASTDRATSGATPSAKNSPGNPMRSPLIDWSSSCV